MVKKPKVIVGLTEDEYKQMSAIIFAASQEIVGGKKTARNVAQGVGDDLRKFVGPIKERNKPLAKELKDAIKHANDNFNLDKLMEFLKTHKP